MDNTITQATQNDFKALYSTAYKVSATHPLLGSQTFLARNKTEALQLKQDLLKDWETVTVEAL